MWTVSNPYGYMFLCSLPWTCGATPILRRLLLATNSPSWYPTPPSLLLHCPSGPLLCPFPFLFCSVCTFCGPLSTIFVPVVSHLFLIRFTVEYSLCLSYNPSLSVPSVSYLCPLSCSLCVAPRLRILTLTFLPFSLPLLPWQTYPPPLSLPYWPPAPQLDNCLDSDAMAQLCAGLPDDLDLLIESDGAFALEHDEVCEGASSLLLLSPYLRSVM